MKNLFHFLSLLIVPLIFTACPGGDDPIPTPPEPEDYLWISTVSPFTTDSDRSHAMGRVSPSGITTDVTVNSSGAWTASSSATWCALSVASGTASDKVLTITVSPNESTDSRSATVIIKSGSKSCSVAIIQAAKEFFSLYPGEVEIPSEGGSFQVTVKCPTSYKISDMPYWVTDVTKSGSGDVRTFKVDPNPEFDSRNGIIVLCDDIGTCLPVSITQKARQGEPVQLVDWSKDFFHRSLFMRFTGTWCVWCPWMIKAQNIAVAEYPDKIEVVALHDNNSKLSFAGTTKLQYLYTVTGFPTGVMDARCAIKNSGIASTAKAIEEAYLASRNGLPTVTAIGLRSSLSGNTLSVEVDMFVKEAGSYKLTLFLLEDKMVAMQADTDNGTQYDYVHNDIARVAASNVEGDPFVVPSSNSHLLRCYSIDLSKDPLLLGFVTGNCRLLAFIQRAYDGSVSKINDSDYDGFFVDNCVSSALGVTVPAAVSNDATGGNENFDNGNPINW